MLARMMMLMMGSGKADALDRGRSSDFSDDARSVNERKPPLPLFSLTKKTYVNGSESEFAKVSLQKQPEKHTLIGRSALSHSPQPPSEAIDAFDSILSWIHVEKLVGIIFKERTDLCTTSSISPYHLAEASKRSAQSGSTLLDEARFERRSSSDLPNIYPNSNDETGDAFYLTTGQWKPRMTLPATTVIERAIISKSAGLVFISDLTYHKLQLLKSGNHSAKEQSHGRKARSQKARISPNTELCVDCRKFGIDFSDRLLVMSTFESNTSAFDRSPYLFDFYHVQKSAKHCPFCKLLFKTLSRNSDSRLVQQKAEKYLDQKLNYIIYYDLNGMTDIGRSIGQYTKYKVNLQSRMSDKTVFSGYHGHNFTSLLLDFSLSVNIKYRGRKAKQEKTQIDEWLTVFSSQSQCSKTAAVYSTNESTLDITFTDKLCIPLDPRPDFHSKLQLLRNWFGKPLLHMTVAKRLPTRLLEVKGHRVRLVQTPDLLQSTPPRTISYVALSHRWGLKQLRTLTTENIHNYLDGLDIAEFPQTFQDAIFVTKHLGLQYLWIDALCILQDSKDDWKIESLKMGNVYQGADVVLAAHCAGDDSDGFLQVSLCPSKAVQFCTVPALFASVRANYDADVTNSQLSRRAWVVQERFLASRTIHFAENHIYWDEPPKKLSEEGMVLHRPEASPAKEGTRVRSFGPSTAKQLRSLLFHEQSPEGTGSKVTHGTTLEWLDLVEMYSQCGLTNEEDKLIAIAGLAKVIQKKTGIPYCAGIWADNIAAGLLWLPRTEALSRPPKLRAPSWSWAALDGPLQYPDDIHMPDFEPACKIIALNGLLVRRPGPFNKQWLNDLGTITLKAVLIDLKGFYVHRVPERHSWEPRSLELLGPGLHPDHYEIQHSDEFPRMKLNEFVPVYPIRTSRLVRGTTIGWIAPDIDEASEWDGMACDSLWTGDLYFLVVGVRENLVAGIFLKSTDEGKQFRRVGMGQLHYKSLLRNTRLPKVRLDNLLDEASWNLRTVEIV